MAVVKDGPAPYAPTPAVAGVITAYRERAPRTPFTVANLALIDGVSESIAPRTLQALKLLDLVDESGEPSAHLVGLKEASRSEYPARLAVVVQEAYNEIFSYHDPATADPHDLVDAFRFYRPSSMRDRMVRLFYGLCEMAHIIEHAPRIENVDSGTTRGARAARDPTTEKAERVAPRGSKPPKSPSPPKPPPSPLRAPDPFVELRAKYVETLLEKFSETKGEVNTELADRIERLIGGFTDDAAKS